MSFTISYVGVTIKLLVLDYYRHIVLQIKLISMHEYDAFVSHAIDVEEFAEQVMRKHLNKRGYKVQMPGHSTDNNIIDAYIVSRYM